MIVCLCEGCGQSWLADSEASLCAECEAVRDPLSCAVCGTQLLVPAPVCGLCTPSVYERALAAMA